MGPVQSSPVQFRLVPRELKDFGVRNGFGSCSWIQDRLGSEAEAGDGASWGLTWVRSQKSEPEVEPDSGKTKIGSWSWSRVKTRKAAVKHMGSQSCKVGECIYKTVLVTNGAKFLLNFLESLAKSQEPRGRAHMSLQSFHWPLSQDLKEGMGLTLRKGFYNAMQNGIFPCSGYQENCIDWI